MAARLSALYEPQKNLRCLDMPRFNLNQILDKYKKMRPIPITKYTIRDVFDYSEIEINNFLLSLEIDINVYNLREKRYLTIYNLYQSDHIEEKEFLSYKGFTNVAYALNNSDNFDEFLSLIKFNNY